MLGLLMSACTTIDDTVLLPQNDIQALMQVENWSLRGRLNVRTDEQNDTININWLQASEGFEINLSGTLGMGAVRITGEDGIVMVEKAGEEPLVAASLEEISSDYLGYSFPAGQLLYWVRGIPAPGSQSRVTANAEGFIANLSQADNSGLLWALEYDRYQQNGNFVLPGRIRLQQGPYQLTFIVSDWEMPAEADG